MRERITLTPYTETQDANYGHEILTAGTTSIVWASVEHKGGSSDERQIADKTTAVTRADFMIRRNTSVTTKYTITWNSATWDILSILEEPRKLYQTLEAVKRT